MTPGFTTWEAVGSIEDNVLLVVNSRSDDEAAVAAVVDELVRRAPRTLHVIAAASWREWMIEHGIDGERALYASDADGHDIELNHFLESSVAIRWMLPKAFQIVVGSAAHSVFNDEVKEIFEQRVALFLGDGHLLAHALPETGLYVFDLASVLHRLGRVPKRERYQARCRDLIDDFHRMWRDQGCPQVADDVDSREVVGVLGAHLGAAVMAFDERNETPLTSGDDTAGGAAHLMRHVEDVLHLHSLHASHLQDVIHARDEALAERNEAVNIRDAIIEQLRAELNTPLNRLKRWVSGPNAKRP